MCSGSSRVVAPLEVCASLRLLDALGVVAGDLVRVCCVIARAGFAAASSSAVMLAIRSLRLLIVYSVLAILLISCSIAASTSSSQSDSDSFSSKIFSFLLREGVTIGVLPLFPIFLPLLSLLFLSQHRLLLFALAIDFPQTLLFFFLAVSSLSSTAAASSASLSYFSIWAWTHAYTALLSA